LTELLKPGFYADLEAKTRWFAMELGNYCQSKGYAVSFPNIASIMWIAFSEKNIRSADQIDGKSMSKFSVLHSELLKRGVYLGPSGYEVAFLSAAHTDEDLEKALKAMCEAMDVVFNGE
jgi:glutamate-1-semialdehyde 2,1-aminomutase